jgi:branched-subunit amino acid transport protein
MTLLLVIGIAALTYASRALALVLMPDPPPRLRAVLDRIPAPLFGSLAAMSLVETGGLAPASTLCAAAGALAATPTRSMMWVLAGGLLGYGLGAAVLS